MKLLIVISLLATTTTVKGWQFESSSEQLQEGDPCQIKTGGPGICRRISSCGTYVEGLRTKSIEYNFLVRCSFIKKEEVICCPSDDKSLNHPSTIGSTSKGNPRLRKALTKPNKLDKSAKNKSKRPSQAACQKYSGLNPANLQYHIIDGVPVAPGEYPHMGALMFTLNERDGFDIRCGASLISERYALTAAHCVNDPLALPKFVRFGVVLWNSTEESSLQPVDVEIENITMHSEYLPEFRYHDVALIKLRKAVEFTPFIRPACLNTDPGDIDSNTLLAVIGWGVTNVQERVRSDVLQMTNVTTVALQDCNATHIAYGTSRSYRSGLNPGHYCAFDPELKKDACQSDSGGPLQLVQNKDSTIVGVVSFGLSCGGSVPSVYARVAYYLDWIESIVWP